MAFAYTIDEYSNWGNKRVAKGTYTNTGATTGGDINTGLEQCEGMLLQPTGDAVIASAPVVNETFPYAGNAITIVNTALEVGIWLAWGF